jgi:hypothetical protein
MIPSAFHSDFIIQQVFTVMRGIGHVPLVGTVMVFPKTLQDTRIKTIDIRKKELNPIREICLNHSPILVM